jgi:hypothetical protein
MAALGWMIDPYDIWSVLHETAFAFVAYCSVCILVSVELDFLYHILTGSKKRNNPQLPTAV